MVECGTALMVSYGSENKDIHRTNNSSIETGNG